MKIRKRLIEDQALIDKLKKENEVYSHEEMASKYKISRSVIIEVINQNIGTPRTEKKLSSKSLLPA